MVYNGPMKRFYKYGISPLRKRFLEQFKKNGEVPVIASLNYLIDEYLTDTQINRREFSLLDSDNRNLDGWMTTGLC